MTAAAAVHDFWRSVCLAEAEWLRLCDGSASLDPAWALLWSCCGYQASFPAYLRQDACARVSPAKRTRLLVDWAGEPSPARETDGAEYTAVVALFWRSLTEAREVLVRRIADGARANADFLRGVAHGYGRPDWDEAHEANARHQHGEWAILRDALSQRP